MQSRDKGLVDTKYEVNTITHFFLTSRHLFPMETHLMDIDHGKGAGLHHDKACVKVMYMGHVCNHIYQTGAVDRTSRQPVSPVDSHEHGREGDVGGGTCDSGTGIMLDIIS